MSATQGNNSTFGWAIANTYLDDIKDSEGNDQQGIAVTLVRPYMTISPLNPDNVGAAFGGKGPKVTTQNARDAFGPLLFPWQWEYKAESWQFYLIKKDGTFEKYGDPQEASPMVMPLNGDDIQAMVDAIETEVCTAAEKSEWAFSALPDHAEGAEKGAVSLVHKLAPLAHMVAPVSHSALCMTHFIPIPKPENSPEPENTLESSCVLAVPVFSVNHDSKEISLTPNTPVKLYDDLFHISYTAKEGKNDYPYKVTIDGKEKGCNIAFVSESVQCNKPVEPEPAKNNDNEQTVERLRRQSTALELAPHFIHPLAIVLRIVQKLRAEKRTSELFSLINSHWKHAFLQVLGAGWVYHSTDNRREDKYRKEWDHAFEPYLSDENLNTLFYSEPELEPGLWKTRTENSQYVWPVISWDTGQITKLIAQIKDSYLTFPSAQQLFWTELIAYLEEKKEPDKDKEREVWLNRWEYLASQLTGRDTAHAIMQSWLQLLAGYGAVKTDHLPELLQNIQTVYSDETHDRQLLVSFDGLVDKELSFVDRVLSIYSVPGPVDPAGSDDPVKTKLYEWLVCALKKYGLNEVEEACVEIARGLCELIKAINSRHGRKAVPRDNGIRLRLDPPEKGVDKLEEIDKEIRGYAVGLRARLLTEDKDEPYKLIHQEWITNTHIAFQYPDKKKVNGKVNKWMLRDESNKPVWAASTVGSVRMGGKRVADIFYDEDPLAAVNAIVEDQRDGKFRHTEYKQAEKDFESVQSIDYNWYSTIITNQTEKERKPLKPVVPLAYGAWYDAVLAPVDNSGIINDAKLRHSKYSAQLVDIVDVESRDWKLPVRYLSLEIPGAPFFECVGAMGVDSQFKLADRFIVSDDTQAAEYIAQNDLNDQYIRPVAFMVSKDDKIYRSNTPKGFTLHLEPPMATKDFIHRWLNTDIAAAESEQRDLISDGFREIENVSDEELRELQKYIDNQLNNDQGQRVNDDHKFRYHPAVTHLGIRVRWYENGKEIIEGEPIVLSLNSLVEEGSNNKKRVVRPQKREDIRWQINVQPPDKVNKENDAKITDKDKHTVTVIVKPGCFVRLDTCVLINEKLIKKPGSENQRKYERFDENIREAESRVKGVTFNGYLAFSATTQWVECGPSFTSSDLPTLNDNFLQIIGPTPTQDNVRRLELKVDKLDATWLKAAMVEQHMWHWTGHPVDFPNPSADTLQDSVLGFASAGSFRNRRQVDFATVFSKPEPGQAQQQPEWIIQSGHVLSRIAIPRTGSSTYDAFTVRPVVRYHAWLDKENPSGPLALENSVMAVGKLRPALPPANRLHPPVIKWTSPLTESYEKQVLGSNALPTRGRNGNLLIFDEAFMRTDNLGHGAGIGEMIEVDVVDTYPYTVGTDKDTSWKESGPNPIFHKAPGKPAKKAHEVAIKTSAPFGLTYDLGSNAKVGQTAVTVFPEGAEGKWWLAKVRTRRMILPETLTSYMLNPEESYILPMRQVGEEWVPGDLAVTLDKGELVPRKIRFKSETIEHIISLPEIDKELSNQGQHRLLVTWHKDRWAEAIPQWRAQVDLYVEGETLHGWRRNYRWTPFDLVDTNWTHTTHRNALEVSIDHINRHIVQLHVSDYTAPIWLSFIGMFGQKQLVRADQYRLIVKKETLEMIVDDNTGSQFLPSLINPQKSIDSIGPKDEYPTINILTIHRPERNILYGAQSTTSGTLVAICLPSEDGAFFEKNGYEFEPGDFAYLHTFQRISSTNQKEIDALSRMVKNEKMLNKEDTWKILLDESFAQDNTVDLDQREALLRPLPMYIGPIRIKLKGS